MAKTANIQTAGQEANVYKTLKNLYLKLNMQQKLIARDNAHLYILRTDCELFDLKYIICSLIIPFLICFLQKPLK